MPIKTVICNVCGHPFTTARKNSATCNATECRRALHARQVREGRADKTKKRLATIAGWERWKNKAIHLPLQTKIKVIMIGILAEQHAKLAYAAKHSQAPLPAERGAVDPLDAVRRLSETPTRAQPS